MTENLVVKNCLCCGEEFIPNKYQKKKQVYCSYECKLTGYRIRKSESRVYTV